MKLTQSSVYQVAYVALKSCDLDEKCQLTRELSDAWSQGDLDLSDSDAATKIPVPGRPDKPVLVPARDLMRRKLTTYEGRGVFIHALAHIEFNAINLALDAVYRFHELPADFYSDWIKVAIEEVEHFSLLRERLQSLGFQYGDFPAHNGLWDIAVKTDDDLRKRMALVPRVFEARGLDVTPGMIDRLVQAGDEKTAAILRIILEDEIGHVASGNRWYHYACEQQGIDAIASFVPLVNDFLPNQLRGDFNVDARLKAGFSADELQQIQSNSV